MKNFYLLLTILFLSLQLHTQTVTKIWHVYHDGALDGADHATSLVSDAEGNIYVTGNSRETTEKGQFTTIKYDTAGVQLWKSDFTGASTTKVNRGNEIIIDGFGNIYAVGIISDKGGDVGILKYNSDSLIWAEGFTPSWFGSYVDEGLDIGADSSGNIYAIGRVTSASGSFDDVYTVKVDENGEMLWEMQFSENSATDYPSAIAVTDDGNVYSLTSSYNFWGTANFDLTTIHYTSEGIEQWISRYNGEGDDMDYGTDINVNENDTQYVCGTTMGEAGNNDYVMMMQNEYGTRLWTNFYSGSSGDHDTAFAITYLMDGRAVITGKSYETIAGEDIQAATTLMINADGTIAWTDIFTGDAAAGASACAVAIDSLDGIYITGQVINADGNSDGLLIKYNDTGEKEWVETFDSDVHLNDVYSDVTLDHMLNVIVTGHAYNSATNSNYLTVKYGQEIEIVEDTTTTGSIDSTGHHNAITNHMAGRLTIFPNPADEEITVQFEQVIPDATLMIFDVFGNRCHYKSNIGITEKINIEDLPAGIYILHVVSQAGISTGRFEKYR